MQNEWDETSNILNYRNVWHDSEENDLLDNNATLNYINKLIFIS